MPFLGAAAGPLIGAGGSILGGLFGGRKSKLEKQISNKINPTLENLLNWAGQANAQRQGLEKQRDMFTGMVPGYLQRGQQYEQAGLQYEPMAAGDLGRASTFYNRLLSPSSTEALSEILGPQRQGLMDTYNSAIQTAGRTGARGGGRTSAQSNFEFMRNRDFMNLVPQARMMAAQGLMGTSGLAGQQGGRLFGQGIQTGQLGLGVGNLGLGYGQLGLGYGNQAENMSRAVLGLGPTVPSLQQARGQAGGEWGSLGGQLGTLLGPLLGGLFGKKSGGLSIEDFGKD